MKSKLLRKLAIPSLCDSSDFGLSDPGTNLSKAQFFLSKKVKDLPELNPDPTSYSSFYARLASTVVIAVVNLTSKELVYFVELKEVKSELAIGVTQMSVWRATNDSKTLNLPAKVFEYILNKFGSVISDDIHTPEGMTFWKKRMVEAVGLGHQVGLINEETGQVAWHPPGSPIDTWVQEVDAWGWDKSHLKFIIKRVKLEQY